uniref:Uncharacterized protein n=1 Tax=Rhodnius prolixus TaxID=13249 RepID=T1HY87_RHOPR
MDAPTTTISSSGTCYISYVVKASRYKNRDALVRYSLKQAVDGRWSTWSGWSSCGSDCRHHKRRSCTNPSPSNGGKFCYGKDSVTANCTGGACPFGKDDSADGSHLTEEVTSERLRRLFMSNIGNQVENLSEGIPSKTLAFVPALATPNGKLLFPGSSSHEFRRYSQGAFSSNDIGALSFVQCTGSFQCSLVQTTLSIPGNSSCKKFLRRENIWAVR